MLPKPTPGREGKVALSPAITDKTPFKMAISGKTPAKMVVGRDLSDEKILNLVTIISSKYPRKNSTRLHNFSFPSVGWGRTKKLRWMNMPKPDIPRREQCPPATTPQRRTADANLKKKITVKYNESTDTFRKEVIIETGRPAEKVAISRWNLRKRKAAPAPEPPNQASRKKARFTSPLLIDRRRPQSDYDKMNIYLTYKEIEEDFVLLTEKKPPRRPKKIIPKNQMDYDTFLPGMWMSGIRRLSEMTADNYKVPEPRRRRTRR